MFIVRVNNYPAADEYLCGATVWGNDRQRASTFATEEKARAALQRAEKFLRISHAKRTQIVKSQRKG